MQFIRILQETRYGKKEIREYLIEDGKYFGYGNENIDSALNIGDIDSATEMVIDEITDRLEGYKDNGGLEIEQWRVYPDRFGSDYGDFYNFIMYSLGANIKNEHLKIAEE